MIQSSRASDGATNDPAVDPTQALNWSALKDFLAVAEAGTLSGAARRLQVSQPTLTRRMTALEESLGAELFRRSPRGIELTLTGESLLGPARQMEAGAQAAELVASGRDQRLSGLVRLTTTEGLALAWLPEQLAAFRELHPAIELEVIIQNTALNLLRREADIAIRLGKPRQAELVARRVGAMVLGLYASRDYLSRQPAPESEADLADHRAVAFDRAEVYTGAGTWIEETIGEAQVTYRANTLSAQRAAIRAGFGIGAQACFVADSDPDLVRVLPGVDSRLDIWLVTHPGLRRSARIRALYDFLAERLDESRALLGGRGGVLED